MIEYNTALKVKLGMIIVTVFYCTFSFVDTPYQYRLMMFGLLSYHLYLFWEEYTILPKGAEVKCLKSTTK
ncbi:hypothetical protein [Bacillus thuringiensis]|uniref:hypothetical protein n=1 Tax=Bacillus thuringiensis TaxID=1428 RepID=UPI000A3717A3|nr:hypothetical protein [Bacillus thuringiensis]OTZ47981.1 hypothetical protein BK762_20065 [Bacillus thuringiensis serovar toumanoffi]